MKKTNRILIYPFILFGVFLMMTFSCKKDDSSSAILPTLTTNPVTNITGTTATCGGNITSDGGSEIIARGVCWSTDQEPTIADKKTVEVGGLGNFSSSMTSLSPNTSFYSRAYAINTAGVGYGNSLSFSTTELHYVPTLTTTTVSDLTGTTATSGGNIASDGGAPITEKGVCWSSGQDPTINDDKTNDGAGTGSFTSSITGLTSHITYYVRAYATNNVGTGYGNTLSFTTIGGSAGTVTDIDGNVYNTVIIFDQIWMVENLKVTHYRNGDSIPNITIQSAWADLTTGAYCDYDNDTNVAATYGKLYNWYAVNDSRKIAPIGWHVPTDAELSHLEGNVGGYSKALNNLKESGSSHWPSTNTATNESGFTALPGGLRSGSYYESFYGLCVQADFWSSTSNNNNAWSREMDSYLHFVRRWDYFIKSTGMSVRCIKDN